MQAVVELVETTVWLLMPLLAAHTMVAAVFCCLAASLYWF
jgi:hypothetical protein